MYALDTFRTLYKYKFRYIGSGAMTIDNFSSQKEQQTLYFGRFWNNCCCFCFSFILLLLVLLRHPEQITKQKQQQRSLLFSKRDMRYYCCTSNGMLYMQPNDGRADKYSARSARPSESLAYVTTPSGTHELTGRSGLCQCESSVAASSWPNSSIASLSLLATARRRPSPGIPTFMRLRWSLPSP